MTHGRRGALGAALAVLTVASCGYDPRYQVDRVRIDRSNHTANFPISSGTHAGIDCNTCHGAYDTFAHFDCTGCHEHDEAVIAPWHTSVAGFSYGPETCYQCHPQGSATFDRATHAQYFPIDSAPHDGAACVSCHPSGPGSFDCTNCHEHDEAPMATTHPGVTGYVWTPTSCYDCHPTGVALNRAEHAVYFPIDSGAHNGAPCDTCHAAGYNSFDCTTCHEHDQAPMDTIHTGLSGYSWGPTSCYTCHPTGEAMSRAAHDPYFPIASGRHALACSDCHVSNYASFECIQCHTHLCSTTDPRHTEVANYNCASPNCYQCHPRGVAGGD